MADSQTSKCCIVAQIWQVQLKFCETLVTRYNFSNEKSQTNPNVATVFEYIPHYGPVILLLCMTTSETGLYSAAVNPSGK